ncbi:MAG TPA: TetR/AcrR family transcriptional regulator [Negativicutes bacterium]|nr:TetR/AcrR family transcriptional regulator [Negativicutes bacterium]
MKDKLDIHKALKNRVKYHKSTFDNISEDRKQTVLNVAISEFAANGFNATNINVIAKKAGISIGSMYSYFESKEALFLTIIDKGFHLLESALQEAVEQTNDIFELFEKLLRASKYYAVSYPELNQIYLDMTTQGLSHLSSKLSGQMESITARLYCDFINRAKASGTVSGDIDERLVSFCLDNLILMFQFSFTSDYYRERMKIFLGSGADDDERLIQGVMDFIRKALSK